MSLFKTFVKLVLSVWRGSASHRMCPVMKVSFHTISHTHTNNLCKIKDYDILLWVQNFQFSPICMFCLRRVFFSWPSFGGENPFYNQ